MTSNVKEQIPARYNYDLADSADTKEFMQFVQLLTSHFRTVENYSH